MTKHEYYAGLNIIESKLIKQKSDLNIFESKYSSDKFGQIECFPSKSSGAFPIRIPVGRWINYMRQDIEDTEHEMHRHLQDYLGDKVELHMRYERVKEEKNETD